MEAICDVSGTGTGWGGDEGGDGERREEEERDGLRRLVVMRWELELLLLMKRGLGRLITIALDERRIESGVGALVTRAMMLQDQEQQSSASSTSDAPHKS